MKFRAVVAGAAVWLAALAVGSAATPALAADVSRSRSPARKPPAASRTIRVTLSEDSGQGSLRAAIEEANAAAVASYPEESEQLRARRAVTIQMAIPAGHVLVQERALPDIEGPGTVLDGGGATIRQAQDCRRADGRKGCDGIVVAGPGITVRALRIVGFMFDGVSVRGAAARDVRIEDVHAIDNLDDGIGVSSAAGPVVIERCLLMGNGYRTKGKGVLVFDDSRAVIRDSVAVANRDGISITRRAQAELERVWIVGSFDKGLGVSGGVLRGKDNRIIANGDGFGFSEKPPNGDGLRVGLGGSAELSSTRIEGNGDAGVVVLDTSSVVLHGGSVSAGHGGRALVCGRDASLRTEDVTVLSGRDSDGGVTKARRRKPLTAPADSR